MDRLIFLALMVLAVPALADPPTKPNPELTPGAVNPAVTQANIKRTICASGWTKTIRPPASFTNRLKARQMPGYGYAKSADPHTVEEDHRVPLEIGGAPRDPKNLWPEPWNGPHGAHAKDKLETAVKRDICSGRLTLEQGRAIFLGDFWAEYAKRYESR